VGDRQSRNTVTDRAGLTRDDVLDAALECLEEDGDGFGIRRLAERLGVRPTTLRWHVGTLDQLLVLVADRVFRDVELAAPPDAGWADALRLIATSVRRQVQARPEATLAARDHIFFAPSVCDVCDRIIEVLTEAGFAGSALASAYDLVIGYILGFPLIEVAQAAAWKNPPPAGPPSDHDTVRYSSKRLDDLTAEWQTERRLMDEDPSDMFFRQAVDTILLGLDATRRV
jgi:AcrR family transcriptional regulator